MITNYVKNFASKLHSDVRKIQDYRANKNSHLTLIELNKPKGSRPEVYDGREPLKVLIFRLHYITMYFSDIKFLTRSR